MPHFYQDLFLKSNFNPKFNQMSDSVERECRANGSDHFSERNDESHE